MPSRRQPRGRAWTTWRRCQRAQVRCPVGRTEASETMAFIARRLGPEKVRRVATQRVRELQLVIALKCMMAFRVEWRYTLIMRCILGEHCVDRGACGTAPTACGRAAPSRLAVESFEICAESRTRGVETCVETTHHVAWRQRRASVRSPSLLHNSRLWRTVESVSGQCGVMRHDS